MYEHGMNTWLLLLAGGRGGLGQARLPRDPGRPNHMYPIHNPLRRVAGGRGRNRGANKREGGRQASRRRSEKSFCDSQTNNTHTHRSPHSGEAQQQPTNDTAAKSYT